MTAPKWVVTCMAVVPLAAGSCRAQEANIRL